MGCRRWLGRALPVLFLLTGVWLLAPGCTRDDEPSEAAQGIESGGDACAPLAATVGVLGPIEYHRTTGKPVTEHSPFQAPLDGELCLSIANGLHDPPGGQRVSAAWIYIDDTLVVSPDSFSQEVGAIRQAVPISEGDHILSVRLASKPGSFLTITLLLLAEDADPPIVTLVPDDKAIVPTDIPFVEVGYQDLGVGVAPESLAVFLNGATVTGHFTISQETAGWQIDISSYLEEGENEITASVADLSGNVGSATSVFEVRTPTDVLLSDLESPEAAYRRRSAYKLLSRFDQIDLEGRRGSLRTLNILPEPKAVDRLLEILQPETPDVESRALAAGAIGEAARSDPVTGGRPELPVLLGGYLLEDRSFLVKSVTARALGLTRNDQALPYLEQFVCDGPAYPPQPWEEEDIFLIAVVGFQAMKSIVRIAGQSHQVCNPGDIMEVWRHRLEDAGEYLFDRPGSGGAP